MKDGRTHLAHKAEHAVDLDTGAVVAVTLPGADQGDTTTLDGTLCEAGMTVAELAGREAELRPDHEPKVNVNGIEELVTDKGYHSGAVLQRVKSYQVCSYIPEKQQKGRRNWQGKPAEQQAVYENRRRVGSQYGKRLLRRRGELVERSFAHCYETGGLRRCHLRGRDNILKRQLVHVGAFNLSLILRQLLGAGTPRELRNRSGELVLHPLLLRWYGNGPQRVRSRGISVSMVKYVAKSRTRLSCPLRRKSAICTTDCYMVVGGFPRASSTTAIGLLWLTRGQATGQHNWYQTDDVYVVYANNGYYMYNQQVPWRRHRNQRLVVRGYSAPGRGNGSQGHGPAPLA